MEGGVLGGGTWTVLVEGLMAVGVEYEVGRRTRRERARGRSRLATYIPSTLVRRFFLQEPTEVLKLPC